MSTASKAEDSATPAETETTAAPTPERHHGDLRKGAYLRRRANYQMQASSLTGQQPGGMPPTTDATARKQRKAR